MARKIKISSSILNLRLHPHTPDIYKSFIQDIYQLKTIVRLHGDRHGMISLINRSLADENIITGTITTFLNVEIDGSWFDTSNLQEATDNQISQVNIPQNLHPNAAHFFFHFDITSHRIYVQNYSKGKVLTPPQALQLFKELAGRIEITQKYNYAKITLVQSHLGLKKLFSIDRIDRITITILKPNADILQDDFEARIEAHLAASHARKLSLVYQADPGASLILNKDIETLSEAALANECAVSTARKTISTTRTEEFSHGADAPWLDSCDIPRVKPEDRNDGGEDVALISRATAGMHSCSKGAPPSYPPLQDTTQNQHLNQRLRAQSRRRSPPQFPPKSPPPKPMPYFSRPAVDTLPAVAARRGRCRV